MAKRPPISYLSANELRVYLCGPINGCTDEECKDWREEMKRHFPDAIDPMRRDYRGKEAESYREIVELDKIDVERSDVVLVNYDKPSVGTSMEVYHAWLKHVPVIVVCREGTIISPWLRYHSTKIVHSFDEASLWIANL
ncbi:nucleoside 2-deoxyribosyltransferase (plasmid) [Bradyrhizobium elkanii]|uniref:nucleoside 2-deoxyribosyltransferase n=1 Tax=Bradyrhizobium elkanii TaxID=29448 RepID=UPI002714BDB3|nr:nucleoside 2-deoxyribosyltransferase [Bradyrhizobium elkanii]WLB14772.1 nucleoside 2-deoxyribosyltransferase [Bradyrhizobium elkanii]WLB69136.1 nucleoside 2-deoxyribosyltransferase [Bradyrhizobium elkanii]